MTTDNHWSEDDHFWDLLQPFIFSERHWEVAPVQVEKILSLIQAPPGAHILDLCCGPGRHALELARQGFRVTGVDRTGCSIERAGKSADEAGVDIEFVRDNMRAFRRSDAFDAAINMFTSFGYFDDPDDDRRILDNIYRSLKKGGCLLMELEGKEILAKKFQPRDWVEQEGVFLLQEREAVDNWSCLKNRWILVTDGRVEEFHLRLRVYSAHELTSLMKEAGFGEISVYGDLDGSPYDHTARRMVVVARRM